MNVVTMDKDDIDMDSDMMPTQLFVAPAPEKKCESAAKKRKMSSENYNAPSDNKKETKKSAVEEVASKASTTETNVFGDDDDEDLELDLMPTQMFPLPNEGAKTGKSNNHAQDALHLEDLDDEQPCTSKNSLAKTASMKGNTQVETKVETSSAIAQTTSSKSNTQAAADIDMDLMPTQKFISIPQNKPEEQLLKVAQKVNFVIDMNAKTAPPPKVVTTSPSDIGAMKPPMSMKRHAKAVVKENEELSAAKKEEGETESKKVVLECEKETDSTTATPKMSIHSQSPGTSAAESETKSATATNGATEEAATSTTNTNTFTTESRFVYKPKSNISADTVPSLHELLQIIISNLYLNTGERLGMDVPPHCATNLQYCYKNHFRTMEPNSPNYFQMKTLRTALEQQRYLSYINFAQDMCHRNEFPGSVLLTELIELVLSINSKTYNAVSLQHLYGKCISLFRLIVRKFPPCWLKMRQHYVNFLQCYLDISKLSSKKKINKETNPHKIFRNLLDMLDDTLDKCTEEELANPEPYSDDFSESQLLMNSSQCSEVFNQWEWEKQQKRFQTFEALSPGVRLERVMVALNLILQILENEFVLWLLHHYRRAKNNMFDEENCPYTVLVFELTQFTRCTDIVKRLFNVFGKATNKNLNTGHLQLIERFISLLMITSNTADMKSSVLGVKYPYLGAETKALIYELFKAFKKQNASDVNAFIRVIEIFRQPYVKYEFIDHFLRIFYFPTGEMRPEKMTLDILKGNSLQKYKSSAELAATGNKDELSVDQYIKLLLTALKEYCEWHGQRTFLRMRLSNARFPPLQTTTDSVHRFFVPANSVIQLKLMGKDIKLLEEQLRTTVRVSKPKMDLPLADICIDDDLIQKYRDDLKYAKILQENLPKYIADSKVSIDLSDMQTYLDSFVP